MKSGSIPVAYGRRKQDIKRFGGRIRFKDSRHFHRKDDQQSGFQTSDQNRQGVARKSSRSSKHRRNQLDGGTTLAGTAWARPAPGQYHNSTDRRPDRAQPGSRIRQNRRRGN